MEDILASIRRIIADDQSRHLSAAAASRRAPAPRSAPQPAPEASAAAPGLDPEPDLQPVDNALPVPHLNPPLAETAAPLAAPDAHPELPEEHLSLLSEIAEAGAAAILAPPGAEPAAVPDPAAAAFELPPAPEMRVPQQHEEAPLEPARPAAYRPPAPAEDLPDILSLRGYEAAPRPAAAVPPVAGHDADPLLSASVGASVESSFQALATSVMMRNTPAMEAMVQDLLRPMLKAWLDDNLPPIVERLVRAEIERVARGGGR